MTSYGTLDGVINEGMERVFEGATEQVVAWLKANTPGHGDLYLISVAPSFRILTISEYLEEFS